MNDQQFQEWLVSNYLLDIIKEYDLGLLLQEHYGAVLESQEIDNIKKSIIKMKPIKEKEEFKERDNISYPGYYGEFADTSGYPFYDTD